MNGLTIACSTVEDGSMRYQGAPDSDEISRNRENFLAKHAMTSADTALVYLVYEGDDYCRYRVVDKQDKGDGMVGDPSRVADAIASKTPGVGLFLLVADCIAAVIYDPINHAVMLSHLGRHNIEQEGGRHSVLFMQEQFGTKPEDVEVWLSPAAGKDNYPLHSFDNKSLHEVAREQLLAAGVMAEKIDMSPLDTTTDPNYYSHSEFLKRHRDIDGRFAVAVMLNPL